MAVRMKAWSATLLALVAVAAVIGGARPAQAAPTAPAASHPQATPANVQEVARKHPSDISGVIVDDHMTMVKYYNSSGQYQFCVANYHHTDEVSDSSEFHATVTWLNHSSDTLPLPGPGGLECSPWRALHGGLHVEYLFLDLPFSDGL